MSRRHLIGTAGASLAAPLIVRPAWAQDRFVNVYNWADYIGETTLEDFTAATGITVNYDNYDSAEAAEAKLMAGSSGYDVVVTAGRNLPRFVQAGIMAPLDQAGLPNRVHLDPAIMEIMARLDPGNLHSIPYMWGTTGVTVNTRLVEEILPGADYTTLDLIFDPEISGKLAACGINMLDSPGTVMPMVLAYLGKDPMSQDPADLEAAIEAFAKVRGNLRSFDNNNYIANMANEELCVTMNWAGDYASSVNRAKEAGVDVPLRYDVPASGGTMWIDAWIIPSDAPHVAEAHEFINYMMDPEVIGKATNYTTYANANKDAAPFVDPAILDNPAVYPDEDVKKRIWLPEAVSAEYDTARTRAWQTIMTGG
jgi:putrescine transport system substrate-binding protein